MAQSWRDRLEGIRAQTFVGREAELALIEAAVAGRRRERLILIYGPGGIGKSELLSHAARRLASSGKAVARIDGRAVAPSRRAVLAALRRELGLSPAASLAEIGNAPLLVAIDAFELLSPVERWLREEILPTLPASVVVVIASRARPNPSWLVEGARAALVPLGNLERTEADRFLTLQGLPAEDHLALYHLTQGHPLALALVSALVPTARGQWQRLADVPDLVPALLSRFLGDVPSAEHLLALRLASIVRCTTESLLAVEVGPRAPRLFDWLRALSFVEWTPRGLLLHDLVRKAVVVDLKARDPSRFDSLLDTAFEHVAREAERIGLAEPGEHTLELHFLIGQTPAFEPVLDTAAFDTPRARPVDSSEWPQVEEMVLRHHGEEACAALRYWRSRHGETIGIYDAGGALVGFFYILPLEQLTSVEAAADAGVAPLYAHVRALGLRGDRSAPYMRFWAARETGQGLSPIQTCIFVSYSQRVWATTDASYFFAANREPEVWAPLAETARLRHFPEADFTLDGHRYGIFGKNLDSEPMSVARLRRAWPILTGRAVTPPTPAPLDRAEFAEAVRGALRVLDRPDQLGQAALARVPLIAARVRGPEMLARLVRDEAARLFASPRDQALLRVLERAYFDRAPKQEVAAEELQISTRTYRRHLKLAVDRLTDSLWRRAT